MSKLVSIISSIIPFGLWLEMALNGLVIQEPVYTMLGKTISALSGALIWTYFFEETKDIEKNGKIRRSVGGFSFSLLVSPQVLTWWPSLNPSFVYGMIALISFWVVSIIFESLKTIRINTPEWVQNIGNAWSEKLSVKAKEPELELPEKVDLPDGINPGENI